MLCYAGIGSRETPVHIMEVMTQLAQGFERKGWKMRSGGQPLGADGAFERGVELDANKEIYLPWNGFDGRHSQFAGASGTAIDMASKYHPNWPAVVKKGTGGQKLHGRNCHIILGMKLNDTVDLTCCWTPEGRTTGGTGMGISISADHTIPVYNLYWKNNIKILREFLGI